MSQVGLVPARDWEKWQQETDGILLDVREPNEWEQGTLPEALRIPVGEIIARLEEIPEDRPILCICRSGGRSQQVASFLVYNGFEDVSNMTGGMKALGMQD